MPIGATEIASLANMLPDLLGKINQMVQVGKTRQMYSDEARKADQIRRITEGKLMDLELPEYKVPESYDKFLGLQQTRQRQEMPGLAAQRADINQSTAATLSGAQNLGGADAAAVLLGANQDRMRALRQLGIAASQYRDQAQRDYAAALAGRSQYEDKAFEYNQWIPYQWERQSLENQQMSWQNRAWQAQDLGAAVGIQGANMFNNAMYGMQMNPNFGNAIASFMPQASAPNTGVANNFGFSYQMPTNLGQNPYQAPQLGGVGPQMTYDPLTGQYRY